MKTFAVTGIPDKPSGEEKGKDKEKDQKTELKGWAAFKANNSWPRTILILLIAVFIVSLTVRTLQEPAHIGWLFGPNGASDIKNAPPPSGGGAEEQGNDTQNDIAIALGPILALALAIERLIETIFDMFETQVENIAKKIKNTTEVMGSIESIQGLYSLQLKQAEESLRKALGDPNIADAEKDKLQTFLSQAQQRVYEAGDLLQNLSKDPIYVGWKRALSIWLGLVLGMVVAVFTDKGVFYYLGMGVPRIFDMLITGFVLGAGSGPLHSLIGILQSAKDTLANMGKIADTTALKDEIRALRARL